MRQAQTRILSLLLALVMCLSLLPITAMAEETNEVSYTVTFDANGGKFPDGSTTMDIQTKWLGAGNNITTTPPDPTREGYTFDGWEIDFVWNYDFQANTTVKATWSKVPELVITFDPNGGICDVKTLPLVDWTLTGTLPTPTRAGYTFLGWFRSGFDKPIQSGEVFSAPETVTAKWSKNGATEQAPVRIDFFANGGRITQFNGKQIPALTPGEPPYYFDANANTGIDQNSGILWTSTNEYGNLSSIPVAVRDGYTFDGWYKLEDNSTFWDVVGSNYFSEVFPNLSGQKLTTSTVNQDSATYVAKWVKTADTFTVTFDLNGATGTPPAPQKVEMGKTVTLPVLRASNAEFLGWGYSTDGRTLTEWKAEYTVTGDLTLYAMWETESNDVLKGLTYRFGNNHEAYGYAENYKIPEERYKLVFGNNELAFQLYKRAGKWGGNCFGMSTTSSMFYVDNDVDTTSFDKNARIPYDLATGNKNSAWNNMSVKEFIEAMQISQYAISMRSGLSNLISAVQSFDRNGPVIIGMTGPQSGHAVVGYAIENDTSTQSRLMIYDPNYPNQEKYITLYKNGSNYTGWYYCLGKDILGNDIKWGSDYSSCTIAYLPYTDYYQLRNSWAKNIPTSRNLLFLNLENAIIKDGDGKTVATVTSGEVSTTRSDVYPMNDYGILLDSATNTNTGAAIWLPSNEAYTITTTANNMEATLVNVDQSATVTTSAQSITFAVNDDHALNCVQIDQARASYEITLSSTLDQGHDDVQLTGTTASAGVSLAQVSGTLYATGIDSEATLKVDGKSAAVSTLSNAMPDIDSLMTGSVTEPTATNPFTDVTAGAYYYDAVLWAVQNSVTSGTSATTFSPDASCTRGQIVTFLWRAAGSPKPASNSNPFTDVKAGAYYYDAVLWAVEKGITSGTSATTFSPDASCTRGQTVTFLYRAAGSPKTASSANPFTDVKAGAYYYDAVVWAVEKKVTSGTSATTFAPDSTVTRGQTVTFLHRSQDQ